MYRFLLVLLVIVVFILGRGISFEKSAHGSTELLSGHFPVSFFSIRFG